MDSKEDIRIELKQISLFWTGMDKALPYTLAEGYFNNFAGTVLEKIPSPLFSQSGMAEIYQVPDAYFESLSGNILSKIKLTEEQADEISVELETIAPLLITISKKPVYSVPETYFTAVDFAVTVKKQKQEAKIINLRSARRWMQYASAAIVTGLLVTGAFLFTDNSNNYLEYENYGQVDIPAELNKVSEEDLVKYLNSQEHLMLVPSTGIFAGEEDTFDVKNNIQDLSDEELTQYLKENGETIEVKGSEKNNRS